MAAQVALDNRDAFAIVFHWRIRLRPLDGDGWRVMLVVLVLRRGIGIAGDTSSRPRRATTCSPNNLLGGERHGPWGWGTDVSVDRRTSDGTVSVVVSGELDTYSAPKLRAALGDVYEAAAKTVVVDLSQLDFIDSTGLGILVGLLKRCRPAGGDLVVANPRPRIAKILEISGLTQIFDIVGPPPPDGAGA